MKRLFFVMALISAGVSSTGGADFEDFQKFSFWDPYFALMLKYHGCTDQACRDSVMVLNPTQYLEQMEELGITMASVGLADSIGAQYIVDNGLNLRLVGQDRYLAVDGRDIAYHVHGGHNVYAEVMLNDPINGYTWTYYGGTEWWDDYKRSYCRLWRPNEDNPGTVLRTSYTTKWAIKYDRYMDRMGISPLFVMKSWDTLTTDTICEITWARSLYDSSSQTYYWDSTIYSYSGVDFQDGYANGWKAFEPPAEPMDNRYVMSFAVNWRGTDSLAMDTIGYRDYWGKYNEKWFVEEPWKVEAAFDEFTNRVNPGGHMAFFPSDESYASQFWAYDRFAAYAAQQTLRPTVMQLLWQIPVFINECGLGL